MRTQNTAIAMMALAGTSLAMSLNSNSEAGIGTHQDHEDAFEAACSGDPTGQYAGAVSELTEHAEKLGLSLEELCTKVSDLKSTGLSIEEAVDEAYAPLE